MSLLLNGAKTVTIAGTRMKCLEIYTGEAYTLPLNFTDGGGNPINANLPAPWNISASPKYYTVDTVEYTTNELNEEEVLLGNLALVDPQPLATDYTVTADWIDRANGTGYLYIGDDLTGNASTPTVSLANSTDNTVLVVVTITITRESEAGAFNDVSREPLGFIVRYQ